MSKDSATAYESFAHEFLKVRDRSSIGTQLIETWAASLGANTEMIEIGCGGGYPVTRALASNDLKIWAVDSSPTLMATFKTRFPHLPVDCARVSDSSFFNRKFDAAVAIGLVFLLSAEEQERFIHRIAEIMLPAGRFLFTAPIEIGTWADITTGIECRSLGCEWYTKVLTESGFSIRGTYMDEGENNYYDVEREPAA